MRSQQRDNVEEEEYAGARSAGTRERRERDGANDLLEAILDRNNLNRAYKQVKRNHGAPGIDGMTVEAVLPWLRENREEILQRIRDGGYKPSPVRRKEIPKPDGSSMRKLGIPTVVDRTIQQAIAQQLQPLFEPLFSEGSYGYRPGRSAQQAIRKVKTYAEQGYSHTKVQNLRKLGVPEEKAYQWGNTRLGYWRIAGSAILQRSVINKRLIQAGYYDFPAQYERLRQLHLNG
ncbi:reverse transcriptase domain-containing protein [Paenibacillus sp. QZ-Y1]|uniref:reverse transcriptase domain-containing protein n=1 Tax=Paenibacillus sp. QZ-Y1 TaxID=3414511 RepID=UPI003F7A19F5